MGEKFGVNPTSGTGSFAIPIPTSPSRSGFSPSLSLTYDSGAGNGPFGFGWTIALPDITRKTDKGLPQYRDAEESDVFVLSGAEDLVPVLEPDGTRFRDHTSVPGFVIQRYRPRIEGLFARIERWTHSVSNEIHWRSITSDNVTTIYGKDDRSRVSQAASTMSVGAERVFRWLPCETYDDKGNAMVYEYVAEDDANVDLGQASERNRFRSAGRYLKRIRYGNVVSRLLQPDLDQTSWLFEVVFDYDEGHYDELPLDPLREEDEQHRFVNASPFPTRAWTVRPDPFSVHRAGFEVRTYRRCRRVLMFHHVPALPTGEAGYDGLVRSIEFDYADLDYTQAVTVDEELAHQGSTRFASFIRSVTQSGYVRDHTRPAATYLRRSLPPLELEYSKALIDDRVRELDPASLENLPTGQGSPPHHWIDLDGEGMAGVLIQQHGAWFYKPNLGAGHFGPLEAVALAPSLGGARAQFVDLAGDGRLDVAVFDGPVAGFYERTLDAAWMPFRPFAEMPNAAWDDPNLRFIDLDGDGRADVLITENSAFSWHRSLAEVGFGPAVTTHQSVDEERGPRLVFANGEQSIYLADMCGDGLTDLVRIRNGEVCYWPNLGYGRFGAKVTMDAAPRLDRPDRFDQARVRLADIDGSGTSDLIYLAHDGARVYFNQSGNRWSEPRLLPLFPHLDNVTSVATADLLGTGTACLVWSSPLPADAKRPFRYIDLMGATKPHLLVAVANNLGVETRVQYAPSTRFYLADERAGRPWITRLPFVVHVVERVETYDRVSGNRFVSRHAYHHGFFDGVEREFRGFGLVEQWDTEEFAALHADGVFPTGTNVEASSHVPPVHTRSWFHLGAFAQRGQVSNHHASEYYRPPGLSDAAARDLLLDDTVLPAGLGADEEREACRALKGVLLRREIYALDGTEREPHPYSVTEQNFSVRVLQRRGANRSCVFFSHAREALAYRYERDATDPRIGHALTLEVDDFGNALATASVGYGRAAPDPSLGPEDQAEQARMRVTYSENELTNAVDDLHAHRGPLPASARAAELTGLALAPGATRFTFAEIADARANATTIAYEQAPTGSAIELRVIEHVRTLYRSDDLTGPLPAGTLESLALPFESYKLALTPGLVTSVYGGRVTSAMLANEARYTPSSGDASWWVPTGRTFYSPGTTDTSAAELAFARAHFFLPHRTRDPFHTSAASTESFLGYDGHDLLLLEVRDALGSRTTAGERNADPSQPPVRITNDYRVLQPALVMDANRNRAAVAFDALGMVVGTAVMGKPEESPVPGDRLTAAFVVDLTQSEIETLLATPLASAPALLAEASTRVVYDVMAYRRDPTRRSPAVAVALARETHASQPMPAGGLRIQISFSYSDGFARVVQTKTRAEPGPTPRRNAAGAIVVGDDGQPETTAGDTSPRWVGSGWTVFDNKGKPVRQYEPFFTDSHRFELDVRLGVSPVLFYDPLSRVVATLNPNHTWEKVLFDPWKEEHWDVNDTVLLDPTQDDVVRPFVARLPANEYLPSWYDQRIGGGLGAAEQEAATRTAIHAATPALRHADSLGRTFLTIAHNRFVRGGVVVEELYATRVVLDIEGNEREVHDANGRLVMAYDYDLLGTVMHRASMEAGERWLLHDVTGTVIRAWDARGHEFRSEFDQLRRLVASYLREGSAPAQLVARSVYGESQPNPELANLRGKIVEQFDQVGVVTSDLFDFKGNSLRSSRRLAREYKATIDWLLPVDLVALDTFTVSTSFDALDRPTAVTTPDESVYRPTFNEANLLETVKVGLRGALVETTFVADVAYDAKGQRTQIVYGNGVTSRYRRDPLTSRLVGLTTTRPNDPARLQDLAYAYDPRGNITHIEDRAHQALYFGNQVASSSSTYVYDAVYRLISASGREHVGQASRPETTWNDAPRTGLPHPSDGQAMRPYTERYEYDPVGNFLRFIHEAANGNWTRTYGYDEPSLLNGTARSNRLSRTSIGGGVPELHSYDRHGNMTSMPHLSRMEWDFKDQLHATARQAVNTGTPETTYYVYDESGQRIRKVTERANGTRKEERIYLGGFELYREYGAGDTPTLKRETLHVMDDVQRIALVETRTEGADGSPAQLIRYQFGNHLGSAALELDEAGRIISYEEYYPYGSTSYQAGRSATEVAGKRYRFTGMERDEESGLAYHNARYFVPWLGRWPSVDPIGIAADANLYSYSGCNPIAFVDIDGEAPTDPPGTRIVRPSDVARAPQLGKADWFVVVPDILQKFAHFMGRLAGKRWIQAGIRLAVLRGPKGPPPLSTRDEFVETQRQHSEKPSRPDRVPPPGPDPKPKRPTMKDKPATPGKVFVRPEHLRLRLGSGEPVPLQEPSPSPTSGGGGKGGGKAGGNGGGSGNPSGGAALSLGAAAALIALADVLTRDTSAAEKATTIGASYVVGRGIQALSVEVVGIGLGRFVGGAVGFVIFMPHDHGENPAFESQRRYWEEVRERAAVYRMSRPGVSSESAELIIQQQIDREMGGDRMREAARELQRVFDPKKIRPGFHPIEPTMGRP